MDNRRKKRVGGRRGLSTENV